MASLTHKDGQPEGKKKTKTEKWDEFSAWFVCEGMGKFQAEMAKLEGRDFIITMKDLMEFFKPKLARTEHTGKDGGAIEVIEVPNYGGKKK